jgi:hypothetical protein
MTKNKCVILVPTQYNDGTPVAESVLAGIKREIDEAFDGHHVAGLGEGAYRMADGSMAYDPTLEIWVAVEPDRIDEVKELARKLARTLKQESIWFEVTNSQVEFVEPSEDGGCQ